MFYKHKNCVVWNMLPGWLQSLPLIQTRTWSGKSPGLTCSLKGEFWHSLPEKAINKVPA